MDRVARKILYGVLGLILLAAIFSIAVAARQDVGGYDRAKGDKHGTERRDQQIERETGWIEFDCTMKNVTASSVITATGDEPIYNVRWNDGAPKTKVYFDYNPDKTTYIRVNAASATSANNSVQLDGNGVAPNTDNYNFTITPP